MPPTRIDGRGLVIVLAPGAPPSLLESVRSVLETDELIEKLPPVAKPGVNARLALLEVDARRFVIKRYTWPFIDAVRTFGHGTRARNEYESLEVLEPLVPAPVRPMAWAEKRSLGFASRSVLVTELLADAVDLKTWRLGFVNGQRPTEERDRLVAQLPELAKLVRRLHDAGFHARTAFHKNVLWRPKAEAREAFSFLDLPFGSRRTPPLPDKLRLVDLACLDKDASMILSRSQRLRLFLVYSEKAALDPADRSALKRVAALTARRAHTTFFWGLERRMKRSFKRTALGKLLTGRDPDAKNHNAG